MIDFLLRLLGPRTVFVVLMDDYALGVFSSRERAETRLDDAKRRVENGITGGTWREVRPGVWATEHVRQLTIQERELDSMQ